jgi:hypothetical protein
MNDLTLTDSPQEEGPGNATNNSSQSREDASASQSRRRRKGRILTADDCRQMLGELPSLITLKLITPAQANAITRTLQTLMSESRASQASGPAKVADENLIALLREQPHVLEMIEPMLTDEQVDQIMKGVRDDAGEV